MLHFSCSKHEVTQNIATVYVSSHYVTADSFCYDVHEDVPCSLVEHMMDVRFVPFQPYLQQVFTTMRQSAHCAMHRGPRASSISRK